MISSGFVPVPVEPKPSIKESQAMMHDGLLLPSCGADL